MKKANDFYEIRNVVEFNNPIDETDNFFIDFSGLRKGFHENKIFKTLNITPVSYKCNKLTSPTRIFLSGHRGTGKTTELLKLKNEIDKTNCFLTVFCDLSREELDMNNIDFVDIIIFMLERLVKELENKNVNISEDDIASFYSWYEQRIEEINTKTDASATIETEAKASITMPLFYSLIARTKAKLTASQDTKDTIRRIFSNKFSEFSIKFNEFILDIKDTIKKEKNIEDLIFILDGFEKIGTLEDRKKILIENSNKFIEIKSNMIIALPIELFSQVSTLSNFSTPIAFPLVTLDKNGIKKFKDFIYTRVSENLFDSEKTVEEIIRYGAGSPRETLKIIDEAFIEAKGEIIDYKSVIDAKNKMSNEIVNYLTADEVAVLQQLSNNDTVSYSDTIAKLLVKKVLLQYADDNTKVINPIISENETYKKLIK